jgi:hypothetical protein
MTEDEVVSAMEQINKTSALFDWLEMLDGRTVGATFEELMASTCELTISKPDILGMG